MVTFQPIAYANKSKFYHEVRLELQGLYDTSWVTNFANTSATLMAHLPRINWVGFYFLHENELRLGPFQGLPACLKIPMGKGVCGTAARERRALLVADVATFPGHIACDARSRSEVVVPLISGDRVLGVLDIDSPEVARFDETDLKELEILGAELVSRTLWPGRFIEGSP